MAFIKINRVVVELNPLDSIAMLLQLMELLEQNKPYIV